MGVLTDDEKAVLAKVETTKEQAEQIVRRNAPYLELVREWIKYRRNDDEELEPKEILSSGVGCPHCTFIEDKGFQCEGCAWMLATCEKPGNDYPCIKATFGDVRYASGLICYSSDREHVIHFETYTLKNLFDLETFLAGHIEWAEIVLAEGA